MRIAAGIGHDVGFGDDDATALVGEAKRLGYVEAWTNVHVGVGDRTADAVEAIERCRRWHAATGIATGVGVMPSPGLDLLSVAAAARKLRDQSGDAFILGIGSGSIEIPAWRAMHGLGDAKPIATMREHVAVLKREAGVPVYLAAMGPRMLDLVGRIADGAMPNWMDPSQLTWARHRIAGGARAEGREPKAIQVVQYVRVAVDDRPAVARRALARAALRYVMRKPGLPGGGHYRRSMTRMGFDAELSALEARRDQGASVEALADMMSDTLLGRLGAWGRPDEALSRVRRLSDALDVAIIRVIPTSPGAVLSGIAVLRACAPRRWS